MAKNNEGTELCSNCNAPQHCNNVNTQDNCDDCRCAECVE